MGDLERDIYIAKIDKEEKNNKNSEKNENIELYDAELLRIVDGDTIEVMYKGKKEKIRFIGIDTPEKYLSRKSNYLRECFWKEASEHLSELILGKNIQLEFDETQDTRGKYGRLLAYIRCNGENINLKMIEDGYAYEYTYEKYNLYKYQVKFKKAELNAGINNKGLWHPNTCNGQR